jgi:hypothetical protein
VKATVLKATVLKVAVAKAIVRVKAEKPDDRVASVVKADVVVRADVVVGQAKVVDDQVVAAADSALARLRFRPLSTPTKTA